MNLFDEKLQTDNENGLSFIWNNINDAIFTIRQDGAIMQANPAFTEMLGYTSEEIKGLSRPPFFLDAFTEEQHQMQLQKFRVGQSFPYFETKRKRKDGSYIDVLASYRAVNKGDILAVATYKDITKEKKMQQKLTENENCYRALVEYSPTAIVAHSKESITYANPETFNLMGATTEDQLIGKPIWEFVDEKTNEHNSDFIKIFKEQKKVDPEPMIEKLFRVDGTEFWAEITAILVTYNGEDVIQAIIRDVTERKKYDDYMQFMAYHDPLTGLSNRRLFMDILKRTVEESESTGEKFSVIYADMDNFKSINDTYGHDFGDELLIQFAGRLQANVRPEDVIGRIGGDEFIILMRDSDKEQLTSFISNMQNAFQKPYLIKGKEIHVTSSIGAAMYPQHGDSTKSLIRNADLALYRAKVKRNRFVVFDEEII